MALAIVYTVSPEERQGNERRILGGNQNRPRISMYTEFLRKPLPCGFLRNNAFPLCGPLTLVHGFPPLRNCV